MPFMSLSTLRESALPRHVDRVAGIPLLWAMGLLRTRRAMPREPAHVGIMIFETIGDTLLAGTLVASLRVMLPKARITVFASAGNIRVVDLMQGIDAVVEVPLLRPAAAIRAVRSVPVDVMINAGQWPRWYALLCALSRARHTIGFDTPGQGLHYAFDSTVPHRRDRHEVANFQALLAPFGAVAAVAPQHSLRPPGPLAPEFAGDQPYVVIHPWAGGFNATAREWPVQRWVELVALICRSGCAVLVSGGPADMTRADALALACGGGARVRSIAGRCSMGTLAAVLAHARAAVSVNTGVMHLAALLGVPLVALHGPTSRLRWGPLGSDAIALAPDGAGCEFLHLGFEYPPVAVHCMEQIEVGEVFASLCSRLDIDE
jgi:heptosyltransferase III